MIPRKLNIFFAFFAYAGNSTGTSEVSDIREWFTKLIIKLKTDPKFTERIGNIDMATIADTPITMNRNDAVNRAKELGSDIIVMVDSDMRPDVHLHDGSDPTAKPFFDVAFDAIYQHYDKGPLVIAAPYGGCPPHENMFVFTWSAKGNLGAESPIELRQYTREEAAQLSGLQPAAALPTGLIAYDMRAFDLIEHPYFYYEWTDPRQIAKASTEDVTNTRDISLAGQAALGYNPVYCAWSSWAGHLKTWCVKKPTPYTVENVSGNLAKALVRGLSRKEQVVDLSLQNADLLAGREIHRVLEDDEEEHPGPKENPSPHPPVQPFGSITHESHLKGLAELVRMRFHGNGGKRLTIIEIGSWVGQSACAMADTNFCDVLCIDHWQGSPSDQTGLIAEKANVTKETSVLNLFKLNVGKRLNNSVNFCVADSVYASKNLDDLGWSYFSPADIIHIDADHSYQATKADILAWLPHVAEDGIMVGHDYRVMQFPGVTKAVHEIFGDYASEYAWSQEVGGFWLVRMKDIDRDKILRRFAQNSKRNRQIRSAADAVQSAE